MNYQQIAGTKRQKKLGSRLVQWYYKLYSKLKDLGSDLKIDIIVRILTNCFISE